MSYLGQGNSSTYRSQEGLLSSSSDDPTYVPSDDSDPDRTAPKMKPFDEEIEALLLAHIEKRNTYTTDDILSAGYIKRIQTFLYNNKQVNRISSMNTTFGRALRLLNCGHSVQNKNPRSCALCGIHNAVRNEQGKKKLRPNSRAYCEVCDAHLCTIPREGSNDNSCWEEWHSAFELEARNYFKQDENEEEGDEDNED